MDWEVLDKIVKEITEYTKYDTYGDVMEVFIDKYNLSPYDVNKIWILLIDQL